MFSKFNAIKPFDLVQLRIADGQWSRLPGYNQSDQNVLKHQGEVRHRLGPICLKVLE
jgi:hypothetical protein